MKNINNFIIEKLRINKDTNLSKPSDPEDPTTWKVDDILVTSGGYSMILVDFYKIIRRTGKSFIVRELKKKNVSGNGWQGECVPIENEFDKNSKEMQVRINKYNVVRIENHTAHYWDGNPVYYDHLD